MTNSETKNTDINITTKKSDTIQSNIKKYEFQAEVAGLLRLMINSVYSNHDVFLRELISNGADACERLRQITLTDSALLQEDSRFLITLSLDNKSGTLSISDNGIGMDHDEMIGNLGTIARSGTRAFLESLENTSDGASLIGQFGVGFYSAFMVADKVQVISRKAGTDETWQWQSDGTGNFTIEAVDSNSANTLKRGTNIILHLKDDAKHYSEAATIENIVREHSAHIPVPIVLIAPSKAENKADNGENKNIESIEKRELTNGSALWKRPKSEISEDDYKEFYQYISGQMDQPVLTMHYRAEGRHEYTVLMFLPTVKPFDLFDPARKGKLKLYVRRVFISDGIELLPAWLRFVRGVIDSEDLPLNISREMLQNNPVLEAIKTNMTNRIITELRKLSEKKPDAYIQLWQTFGAVIKEGLYEDFERRDKLFEIVRFKSTYQSESNGGWRSLKDYVGDMRENQTKIFYLTGDNQEALKRSPHLEGYRARGVEVLLLEDPVDAFWVQMMPNYDGKPFQSVTQGAAELDNISLANKKNNDENSNNNQSAEQEIVKTLIDFMRKELSDQVSDVRISKRLDESPVCLVAPDKGPDRQLKKLLGQQNKTDINAFTPILEINPNNSLIAKIAEHISKTEDKSIFSDTVWMLLDQARIIDGELPINPHNFATRLSTAIKKSLDS